MQLITRQEAGLASHAIRRRIKSGKWQELFPGVYLASPIPATWELRLRAACIWAGGMTVVSGRAAGKLYGFPGLTEPLVEITTERDVRSSEHGVIVHKVSAIHKRVRTRIGKIPVTTPTATVLDLAAVLGEGELQAVVQFAIQHQLTTWNKLMAAVEASPQGRRGTRTLRRLLIEGLDSHLERLLKRVIKKSNLPAPSIHFKLRIRNDEPCEVDFAYPELLIALEADGWAFHSDPDAFQRDREKWRELQKIGWIVLCFTHEDIVLHPEEVIETIFAAIRNARQRRGDVLV